jgi:DNA-binding response OmpR family regulator
VADEAVLLLVSDDERLRSEVANGLSGHFSVRIAEDSRSASRLMSRFTPAVVIADIRTGSAGGSGLVRDMRQDGRLRDVPVLMLLERPQDAWLAKTSGADLVRTKPISIEQLLRDVASLGSSSAASA